MDDVGQTLLNWASAFGTLEMVCIMSFPFIIGRVTWTKSEYLGLHNVN